GMAVTSHANGTLTTGVFSDVIVRNITPPNNNVNLALGKTATASTEENATYSSAKATDGDATGTRWASSFANVSEWIYVDLGANYNINRVVLKWEA
ncbi:discoidin domain-containing protein, partial [Flavobacterium sp. LBUM151]